MGNSQVGDQKIQTDNTHQIQIELAPTTYKALEVIDDFQMGLKNGQSVSRVCMKDSECGLVLLENPQQIGIVKPKVKFFLPTQLAFKSKWVHYSSTLDGWVLMDSYKFRFQLIKDNLKILTLRDVDHTYTICSNMIEIKESLLLGLNNSLLVYPNAKDSLMTTEKRIEYVGNESDYIDGISSLSYERIMFVTNRGAISIVDLDGHTLFNLPNEYYSFNGYSLLQVSPSQYILLLDLKAEVVKMSVVYNGSAWGFDRHLTKKIKRDYHSFQKLLSIYDSKSETILLFELLLINCKRIINITYLDKNGVQKFREITELQGGDNNDALNCWDLVGDSVVTVSRKGLFCRCVFNDRKL